MYVYLLLTAINRLVENSSLPLSSCRTVYVFTMLGDACAVGGNQSPRLVRSSILYAIRQTVIKL